MNILYIDIDSLRPDHLGCYGYGRNTSPNIDRLAAEGVRFNHCYAADVPCMPSRTSLFSGKLGYRHGCVSHTGRRAEPFSEGTLRTFRPAWAETSWPRRIREAGLHTVTFSPFGERHGAWHWYAGFSEIHDTGKYGHETADDVAPGVLSWLQGNAVGRPWFLHVNLWDVHVPYRTPTGYPNPFADEPLPDAWLTQEQLDEHYHGPGIRSARDAWFLNHPGDRPDLNPTSLETLADVRIMHDGYDTAIRYVDDYVGQMLALISELGLADDTAVIVSADHGEGLGELNAYGGHCLADQATTRIPLIVRWPGVTTAETSGSVVDDLCYNIDLSATVTELLGGSVPDAWDAQSLVSVLRGRGGSAREQIVLSRLAQTCQRAVRFRDNGTNYLFIRTYRNGYYPFPDNMLFDLDTDPHEQHDLGPSRPDIIESARERLGAWKDEMASRSDHDDPLTTVLADPIEHVSAERYARRLRDTGRGDWIDRLGLSGV